MKLVNLDLGPTKRAGYGCKGSVKAFPSRLLTRIPSITKQIHITSKALQTRNAQIGGS